MEKVYIVLLDYADDCCSESRVDVLGTYRTMESAQKRLEEWKKELLDGDSWEATAYYNQTEENGEEIYSVEEDAKHFEIYEIGYYDRNHTLCRILTKTLED